MQAVEVQPVRRVVNIHDDPVAYYLTRLAPDNTAHATSQLRLFFAWVNQQDGYVGVTPRQLLIKHLQSEDEYETVELIQRYLDSRHDLRTGSKEQVLTVLKAFFRKNRAPLPAGAEFTTESELPPVEGRLTVEEIRKAVSGSNLCWQSLLLVKYQAFLDHKRLAWVNKNSAEKIVQQLREGKTIVRLDVPCGRKKNKNRRQGMYFTYFGHDAAEALRKYFTEIRGWPGPGDPIWVWGEKGVPLDRKAIGAKWLRLMRHLNIIPSRPSHNKNQRYGFGAHEMRDVATSYLHVHAKGRGLDMDAIKFWSGQVGSIDRNKYDKFYKDQQYVLDQYKIAEPCLNILTQPDMAENTEEVKTLREDLELQKTIIADLVEDVRSTMWALQDAKGFHAIQSLEDARKAYSKVRTRK